MNQGTWLTEAEVNAHLRGCLPEVVEEEGGAGAWVFGRSAQVNMDDQEAIMVAQLESAREEQKERLKEVSNATLYAAYVAQTKAVYRAEVLLRSWREAHHEGIRPCFINEGIAVPTTAVEHAINVIHDWEGEQPPFNLVAEEVLEEEEEGEQEDVIDWDAVMGALTEEGDLTE